MNKLLLCLLCCIGLTAMAQVDPILSERRRAEVIDQILEDRINNLLPTLMEKTGIDCWVLISREYNEDPVLKTFLPATWLSARRRTILVFYHPGPGKPFEKWAIARYNVGETIKAGWDMKQFPDQWDQLMNFLTTKNPRKIGLNTSAIFGHADGLVHTEHEYFMKKLPPSLKDRVVPAEPLAVAWLETRTDKEMMIYPQLVAITHQIIEEGFSEKVITPGITTTDEVVWWFREKFRHMGLDTWFHPTVDIQRSDSVPFDHLRSFSERPKEQVILPGDLLHVDIGITYLRLNTDVQQHAYVLKPGEQHAPAYLQQAFKNANRVQDLLTSQFQKGKSGNQLLSDALNACKKENLQGVIYTHPLGLHGHAAGPTIGMWDNQGRTEGSGDYRLNENTAYSIELNCSTAIPEWKKSIRIMLEEDGFFDGTNFRYIHGRQTELYTLPRARKNIQ